MVEQMEKHRKELGKNVRLGIIVLVFHVLQYLFLLHKTCYHTCG